MTYRVLSLVALLLFTVSCGSPPKSTSLDQCLARHGDAARKRLLPACVDTEEGAMATDSEYISGVVDCELGWFAKAPSALMAQAVAARTYLAKFLDRKGERAVVPIGPHFQCWRATHHARSRRAAEETVGIVMHYKSKLINGNYAAGARKVTKECMAQPPKKSGYDYKDWATMRARYLAKRKHGKRRVFKGVYWTELLITRNEGLRGDAVVGSAFASTADANRGALGQYAASCLGDQGYDTARILRYFYGEDIAFSRLPPDGERYRTPLEDELPDLVIPPMSYRKR